MESNVWNIQMDTSIKTNSFCAIKYNFFANNFFYESEIIMPLAIQSDGTVGMSVAP